MSKSLFQSHNPRSYWIAIERNTSPPLEIYSPQDYKDLHPGNEDNSLDSLPIALTDTSEYEPGVDEYGGVQDLYACTLHFTY